MTRSAQEWRGGIPAQQLMSVWGIRSGCAESRRKDVRRSGIPGLLRSLVLRHYRPRAGRRFRVPRPPLGHVRSRAVLPGRTGGWAMVSVDAFSVVPGAPTAAGALRRCPIQRRRDNDVLSGCLERRAGGDRDDPALHRSRRRCFSSRGRAARRWASTPPRRARRQDIAWGRAALRRAEPSASP